MREFLSLFTVLLCVAAGSCATHVRAPSPAEIVNFTADPPPANEAPALAGFDITRDDVSTLLETYRLVSREDWSHGDRHVAFGDRTGTLTLRDGTVVTWLARPGGRARLTLSDGTQLHLALSSGLSTPDVRMLATRYRDEWLAQTRPEEEKWLSVGFISSVERLSDGWHVEFRTKTGDSPQTPEGLHVYCLHVYVDASGALGRIVRGPDLLS